MKCVKEESVNKLLELLPEEKVNELINNKIEVSKQIKEILKKEKMDIFSFDIEYDNYLDTLAISDVFSINKIYNEINNLNNITIHDILPKEFKSIQSLLYKLTLVDLDVLLNEILSIEINIFNKNIKYINDKTAKNVISMFSDAIADCQILIDSVNTVIESAKVQAEKSFFKKRRDKYTNAIVEFDNVIFCTEKFKDQLTFVKNLLVEATDKAFKVSNVLSLELHYSKELV